MSNSSLHDCCHPDYHERYKDDVYYEEQGETHANCYSTSGAPLHKLAPVATIPDYDGGFSAVNWDPATNNFLICKPGMEDFPIYRTDETLRALAKILAFNPKEWGCSECGCTTEFKNYEYICWCDTCKDGCSSPVQLEPLPAPASRKPSVFFSKRRGSLPPPPLVPLERLTAIGSHTISSPDSKVIMEDTERDEWFSNAADLSLIHI